MLSEPAKAFKRYVKASLTALFVVTGLGEVIKAHAQGHFTGKALLQPQQTLLHARAHHRLHRIGEDKQAMSAL